MKKPATNSLQIRSGLPDALRVLADAYPRANWERHKNFGDMIQFWMQRHLMFRQLTDIMRSDVQSHLDGKMTFREYAPRLSHYGGTLLNDLHGHHHIEDSHYFPQLITLDARLERAFDLLESDHQEMDGLLNTMANGANAVLQGGEAGVFLDQLNSFTTLLNRHLEDEEDIVVPVVLDTGFRG